MHTDSLTGVHRVQSGFENPVQIPSQFLLALHGLVSFGSVV
jgi:hypothetical protein